MQKIYTHKEMLAIWRRTLGFECTRADASVAVFEGISTDLWLGERMRRWYLRLLDTASPSLLPVTEGAPDATLRELPGDMLLVSPAPGVRRVVSVRMEGWQRTLEPLDTTLCVRRLRRMASPYARPDVYEPLAVTAYDGVLVTPPASGIVAHLGVIADPGPDNYILDESLLETITPKEIECV